MIEAQHDPVAVDALVRRAGAGDTAAFAALYDLFAPRVRRFVRHRTRDTDRAEDLVQQTFLRMIEALPRYRCTSVPFGAWVFRIARNLVIDDRRAEHPSAPIEIAIGRTAATDDPVAEAIRSDDRTRLLIAVDGLPADQREVLVCRFLAELTPGETAILMRRSPEAVRALQHRAILALRALLADHDAAGTEVAS
jgi:RNA polymerase sigma-70 factor (ECF subfamily)